MPQAGWAESSLKSSKNKRWPVKTNKTKFKILKKKDVSGTDSPFRETSNVYDGSAFTADMAVQ